MSCFHIGRLSVEVVDAALKSVAPRLYDLVETAGLVTGGGISAVTFPSIGTETEIL